MMTNKSYLWQLLHPIQAYKIRKKNKIIILKLKLAYICVLNSFENRLWNTSAFKDWSDETILNALEIELQQAGLEVLKEHGIPQ